MGEEKKDVWLLDVNRMSALKVAYAEPVTRREAMELFDAYEHEDVIDEEDHGVEVVGAR